MNFICFLIKRAKFEKFIIIKTVNKVLKFVGNLTFLMRLQMKMIKNFIFVYSLNNKGENKKNKDKKLSLLL